MSSAVLTKTQNWLNLSIDMIPNILFAIIIIVFYFIGKLVRKFVFLGMKHSPFNDTLNNLTATTAYLIVLVLGLIIALQIVQLDRAVVSLLAGAGIIGIALAFAFQDTAANFLSGIILAFKRPFKIHELIETNSYQGKVQNIGLRTTTIESLQGKLLKFQTKKFC